MLICGSLSRAFGAVSRIRWVRSPAAVAGRRPRPFARIPTGRSAGPPATIVRLSGRDPPGRVPRRASPRPRRQRGGPGPRRSRPADPTGPDDDSRRPTAARRPVRTDLSLERPSSQLRDCRPQVNHDRIKMTYVPVSGPPSRFPVPVPVSGPMRLPRCWLGCVRPETEEPAHRAAGSCGDSPSRTSVRAAGHPTPSSASRRNRAF
jgi:hypothetical protein